MYVDIFKMTGDDNSMKKIVLSGSMSLLFKMKNVAEQLAAMGYRVILPRGVDWQTMPKEKFSDMRKELSMKHFDEIAAADTDAVLVVNDAKGEIANYIGANTFAEIALAFYFGKTIFLLNDVYGPYQDELSTWGVTPLKSDLSGII